MKRPRYRPCRFSTSLPREGNIPERDMFNTFNMGVGMTHRRGQGGRGRGAGAAARAAASPARISWARSSPGKAAWSYGKDQRCWYPAAEPICRPSWTHRPRAKLPHGADQPGGRQPPGRLCPGARRKGRGCTCAVLPQGHRQSPSSSMAGRCWSCCSSHGIELVVLAGFLTILRGERDSGVPQPHPQHSPRR